MNALSNDKKIIRNEIRPTPFVSVEETRLFIYDVVMKKLSFTCEVCDGALVPISTCASCKKTVSRKCRECGVEVLSHHTIPKSELRYNHDLAEVKLQ